MINRSCFDAHADWISPRDVEQMSHEFMLKIQQDQSPSINIQHKIDSTSRPVESSIVEYPDKDEYKKAMANQPHKIYRRVFGSDVVHSGSWIMATKLSDSDWRAFKDGKLNAYSIEGTGFREPMKKVEMPKVEIIDLVPKK
jgi:hypothetical protein